MMQLLGHSNTVGGAKPFDSCYFPFEYKGNFHNSCIIEDSPRLPWCATQQNFSYSNWGYCDCTFGNIICLNVSL